VVQTWRERQRIWLSLVAATGPIVLIGLWLMLYNARRFGNPFEFGLHYQLSGERRMARQFFSLHDLWFNFRVYFLEPVRWTARSPFVQEIVMPPIPSDHGNVEHPFGVVSNIPLVWLALAAPLAWRDRSERAGSVLRWFVTAVALFFGIEALTLGFYYCTASRFEVEFLPALLLLAVVGILGLERALASQPFWRRVARGGYGLLLAFSMAFNLLAGLVYYAEVQTALGNQLFHEGKVSEAFGHYERALQINPDYAKAHESLANALVQLGRLPEAIVQYQQALRINPEYTEAHCNLGGALLRVGRVQDAIAHYEEALRIKPDFYEAHNNLGSALANAGRMQEAMQQWEESLRLKPNDSVVHYNLGSALEQAGRLREAVEHYEQALRINPDYTLAQNALARLQARQ
jgi:tetratricopeptide (TPR) repeat protein